ncbi:MAG: serine hydrolase domain-containing protein, partial [Bacteroidota bacterium]
MKKLLLIFLLLPFFACEEGREIPDPDPIPPNINPDLYFPPLNTDEWESISPAELEWNEEEIPALLQLLENNDTRAFLLLKNGKIAIEAYFGRNLLNTSDFNKNTLWYWASAGKTLTAFTVGMAQEEGFLDIEDKSSEYLGEGWTSLTPEQESEIKVWNQLTMTSGLDDGVSNSDSFEAEDLIFKSKAGDRWAYHNAPYT